MTISAYPLQWVTGFPRTKFPEQGKFKTTLASAIKNVDTSLRLFASDSRKPLKDLVISSNYSLGCQNPKDAGVAVWFVWDGLTVCIPVDRYHKVESNLQAIHHIIEARRVELRHGTLALVRASFAGFIALPAPTGEKQWFEVLEVDSDSSMDVIKTAYRKLSSIHHPDRGGNSEKMAEINNAYNVAFQLNDNKNK